MELEGFGASLVGRAIYVVSDAEHAWIPWEFISGTQYSARILITGEGPGVRLVQAENSWNAVVYPSTARDWSFIATLIKSSGGAVLLVMDSHAPAAPPTFQHFMDGILGEGRISLTRVWIGTHTEIPTIPDAILFPPLHDSFRATAAYDMIRRLPARGGHGAWAAVSAAEWGTLVEATARSDLGILISDVGESAWSLFWHKLSDSAAESHGLLVKRGLAWLRTGAALLEKNQSA
jgi:hypothetical protein